MALAIGAVVLAMGAAPSNHLQHQKLPTIEWLILPGEQMLDEQGKPIPHDLRQHPEQLPKDWYEPKICTEPEMMNRRGCRRPLWA